VYFHHLLSSELVFSRLTIIVLSFSFLSFMVFTICLDVVHGLVVCKCSNKKKEEIGHVITLLELLFNELTHLLLFMVFASM
jgi:hypothetical protein